MEVVKGIADKWFDKQAKNKKIWSIQEWFGILNRFKANHHRCETNCYIPLPQMEEYIKAGRLKYEIISDTTLWLYEQERDYYLGYYYVLKEEKLQIQPQDLDVIIYLIGNEKKYPKKREKELTELGCSKYRKNLEYVLALKKMPELQEMEKECQNFVEKMDFRYMRFRIEDYESVYTLWRERIDRYSVKDMLPTRIYQMEREGECLLVRDKNDNMIAACDFEINGTVACIENIATVINHTGIGIGSMLLTKSVLNTLSRGCVRNTLWVWEYNMESRKMTERFAVLSGRFSQQLLLKTRSGINKSY